MKNSIDFFNQPFTPETIIKLEFYERYVESAVPVFISLNYIRVINIFDFFAGAGRDSQGVPGSPIRAIEKLKKYEDQLRKNFTKVHLYLNDYDPEVYQRLIGNVEAMEFDRDLIRIIPSQEDFSVRLEEVKPIMKNPKHASIAFFDQFGIDKITPDMFKELTSIPFTDILFFVSSSVLKRFGKSNRMAFIDNFQITPEDLDHVWDALSSILPE